MTAMRNEQVQPETGEAARRMIRQGNWTRPTAELAPGFVQANLVVVPIALADAFETFCECNRGPLPLLERLPDGSPVPVRSASNADVRTDIPMYRIYRDGVMVREVPDLQADWQGDSCAFLLGCSFTFDALLARSGIPVRHLEQRRNVPMYRTRLPLHASPPFSGHLVVSMRSIPEETVDRVVELTRPWTLAHGAPVHIGRPEEIGIDDLTCPQFGDSVEVRPGDVPVFWACGVSAQEAAIESHISSMMTHAPGHMFITDLRIENVAEGR